MRQKIDIADVEAATKIRAKYLRALENEEFGLLPGPTFVKTFLRTYAEYLGLDAQLLVEEYRVAHEPRGEELGPIGPTQSRRSRSGGRSGGGGGGRRDRRGPRVGPPGPGAVVGVVLLLLLGVFLVLGLTAQDSGKDTTTPTTGRAGTPAQTAADKARKKKERDRAARKKKRAAAAKAKVVTLRLAPAEPTYACVVDGTGKLRFGGTMSTPRTFTAKRLRINLGRTSVKATVNGKRLAIPAGSNPVGYDLRPGRKPVPLPLGQRPNC
jgi:cytoskeletal protein RodZ